MIGHAGGELWSSFAGGTPCHNCIMGGSYVGDLEIENGVLARSPGALRSGEHQADWARSQEGEIWTRAEQNVQPQGIAIKREDLGNIADSNGDLPNFGEFGFGIHVIAFRPIRFTTRENGRLCGPTFHRS